MFIFVALGAYFLGALAVILDKFLLGSKRISSAPVYSFYIAIFGLFALFFLPFVGFSIPNPLQIFLSLSSGAIFSFGILALYFAIQKSEASRVTPVVGAIVPIITYFLSTIFSKEQLFSLQIFGVILLIFGGLLISFDLPLKISKKKFFAGFYYSLLSGLLLALAYFLFKFVYEEQSFFNGFAWTRIGCFLSAMSYLLIPSWRKNIFSSFRGFKKPKKQEYQTGGLFIFNKVLGGMSSILLNGAISLGSVTLVNSLISSQYVFILAIAFFAQKKYPFIFQEKLLFWDWAQKIAAIALIGAGIFLIY